MNSELWKNAFICFVLLACRLPRLPVCRACPPATLARLPCRHFACYSQVAQQPQSARREEAHR